jgi:hypothetical protein
MTRSIKTKAVLLIVLTIQILFFSFKKQIRDDNNFPAPEGFALVELFTSEGCSSCPPADEAVGRLKGWKKNVYVLSFHVDYWDYLGWKDIFSNAAYSKRQQNYGDLFQLSSIYTPQIVVNGKVQFVGGDETMLRTTIEKDLKEIPKSVLQIKVQPEKNNQIAVLWETNSVSELKINFALVQNFTKDHIQRGENKGRTLNHYYTVRDFQSLPVNNGSNTTFLTKPPELKPSDFSIIAFLQNPKTGFIIAATQYPEETRN